jgi:7-carboxy-7-deazaguanine synthase
VTRRAKVSFLAMKVGYVSEVFSSFQGEGIFAGRRHVFFRLAGCNLRCGYCDTPESLERTSSCVVYESDGSERSISNPLDVETAAALLEPFLADRGVHALAVTGGEPLVQSSFLAELLRSARPAVPILLETNGTYADRLAAVLPYLDIVSMDIKLPSNSGEAPLWEEHRDFLRASRGKTVYVKVPVDEDTRDDEVSAAATLVAEIDPSVVLFLQPILSPQARMQVTPSRLARFYDLVSAHLRDVRVMPQAHRALGVR